MTTIIAFYTVIPSEATPKRRLSMSESDDIVRWTHAPTIYIYKGNHNDKYFIIKSLSDSLSKILVHYYPLAGRLSWIEGGRLELECNAKGALLLEAESTKTYMSVYGADFGWGKTVYFCPGSVASDGKAFIIQSSQEDGSIVILLRL
ncbi:hypothetical protein VNO77_33968 [Canavalia gladiata]|uniref:Uncharacterized protein n=1 Tax=Canavalia gladiata TaxID=3824 RepID=A0AAN9KEU3_CANGL